MLPERTANPANLDMPPNPAVPMDSSPIPRRADAVVGGGGCMGASAAFHLARRGLDVVLVEKDDVGAGATGRSGAIVRQHYETRVGIRLARDSLAFFNRFEEETSLSCDFRRTGFLSGARERDVPAFEALLALLRAEGVKAQRLGPEEAAEWSRSLTSRTTRRSSTSRTPGTRTRSRPPSVSRNPRTAAGPRSLKGGACARS